MGWKWTLKWTVAAGGFIVLGWVGGVTYNTQTQPFQADANQFPTVEKFDKKDANFQFRSSESNSLTNNSPTKTTLKQNSKSLFSLAQSYYALADQADTETLIQWLDESKHLTALERDLFKSVIYQRLMEIDPQLSLDHMSRNLKSLSSYSLSFEDYSQLTLTMQMLHQWSIDELEQATHYLENMENRDLRQTLGMTFIMMQEDLPIDQLNSLAARLGQKNLVPSMLTQRKLKEFENNPTLVWNELISTNDPESRATLGQAANLWGSIDPLTAIAAIENMESSEFKKNYMSKVISSWAVNDHEDAIVWLALNSDQVGRNAATEVFSLAADKDPRSAIDFIEDIEPKLQEHAVKGILESWSEKEPHAAANWILNARPEIVSDRSISTVMQSYTDVDFEAAWDWGLSLPEELSKTALLNAVSSLDAEQFQSTATKVQSISNSTLQIDIGKRLVKQWAYRSPSAALQWIQTQGDNLSNRYYPDLVESWSQSSKPGAVEFASELAPSLARDKIHLSLLSSQQVQRDSSQKEEILGLIDDPQIKAQAIRILGSK